MIAFIKGPFARIALLESYSNPHALMCALRFSVRFRLALERKLSFLKVTSLTTVYLVN